MALRINSGDMSQVIRELRYVSTLSAAVISGWKPVSDKIMNYCKSHQIRFCTHSILSEAAKAGNIRAMRDARRTGATTFDSALVWAARGGHIQAMREAHSMGARDFNTTLTWAAREGQVEAMREAASMGASDIEEALVWATRAGHIEAMREARRLGASGLLRSLCYAAERGHIEAMREAHRMGAAVSSRVPYNACDEDGKVLRKAISMGEKEIEEVLSYAARGGHLEAIREAVRMGASNFDWALESATKEETKGFIHQLRREHEALALAQPDP